MSDAATSTAITTTEKPKSKASWVQEFVSRAKGEVKQVVPAAASPYLKSAGGVVRAYGEAVATGAILGAADAMFGTDPHGVPVDAALSGLAAIGAIASPSFAAGATEDFRTVGAVAIGGFTRRKTDAFISGKRAARGESVHGRSTSPAAKGATVHGEIEGDPIVALAEKRLREREPAK